MGSDECYRSVKQDSWLVMKRLSGQGGGGPTSTLAKMFDFMLGVAVHEENEDDIALIRSQAVESGATAEGAKKLPRSSFKTRIRT